MSIRVPPSPEIDAMLAAFRKMPAPSWSDREQPLKHALREYVELSVHSGTSASEVFLLDELCEIAGLERLASQHAGARLRRLATPRPRPRDIPPL